MIIQKNKSIATNDTDNNWSKNTANQPPTNTLIGKNGSAGIGKYQ